jgi:hypothetical protein
VFVVVGVVVHVYTAVVAASLYFVVGHGVVQSVEALRYKSEGRGFDFRRCSLEFFIGHIPSGRTMALELTQPLRK